MQVVDSGIFGIGLNDNTARDSIAGFIWFAIQLALFGFLELDVIAVELIQAGSKVKHRRRRSAGRLRTSGRREVFTSGRQARVGEQIASDQEQEG